MNLYSYIASMNPRKANLLLKNNGFGEGTTTSEIERRLKQYVREEKEEALKEMAKIHPDKELIVGDGVEREMLPYSGQAQGGYMGQQFLQNLDTTTYYGPNAAQNPYRPIAPDFFNNAIGVSQEQFPMNKSAQGQEDVKQVFKDALNKAIDEVRSSNTKAPEPVVQEQPKQFGLTLSQNDIVVMLGFAFLGYLIAKKGI